MYVCVCGGGDGRVLNLMLIARIESSLKCVRNLVVTQDGQPGHFLVSALS